jgi:molybdate transport system substrate-binding protein
MTNQSMVGTFARAALAAAFAPLLVVAHLTAVRAADVTMLGFLSLRPIITDVAPEFERATGHRVVPVYDSIAAMRGRITSAIPPDVVVASRPALDDLARGDLLVAGSIIDIARITIRLFVRAGAPKPDIGSVEALRRTLLEAPSLAFTDPGRGALAGRAFAEALKALGIADQLAPKSHAIQGLGSEVVAAVASGEAAIGAAPTNDLTPLPGGIEIVGALPKALGSDTVIAAGMATRPHAGEAAVALIRFLASPAAAVAFTAHGIER